MTRFCIPGIPTKRRPRFAKNGRVYVDARTQEEEATIAAAYHGPKITGKVEITVDVYPKLAKNTPKTIDAEPFLQRPDADNIAKVIMDGLQGKAYGDDKQVCSVRIVKHDKTRIERDYTVVTVAEMRER